MGCSKKNVTLIMEKYFNISNTKKHVIHDSELVIPEHQWSETEFSYFVYFLVQI